MMCMQIHFEFHRHLQKVHGSGATKESTKAHSAGRLGGGSVAGSLRATRWAGGAAGSAAWTTANGGAGLGLARSEWSV